MPTYEYKCTKCDERFDIEQSFTDDPIKTKVGCEVDGSGRHRLKKVFGAVGIAFKGDGFYRNDSRGGSSKSSSSTSSSESGSSDSGSSSDSSDSGSSKSESKSSKKDSSKSTSSSDSSSGSKKSESATTG